MHFDNSAIIVFAAIIPCLLALKYWRGGVFVFFVLVVFEGALRKWVLPGAQAQLYLFKDVVLLCAYFGFLLSARRDQLALPGATPIKIVLALSFAFGCIEVLNPNSPSLLVGLMGLKAYFLYAPLAFVLPYAFKSRNGFLQVVRAYIILAIPVAALGIVQIASGRDSIINTYVSRTEEGPALAYFGSEDAFVRTSGTFSYISGYTSFLSFIALLAIGYNMGRGWRLKSDIGPILALILVVGAMFTTGSRTPVFILLAGFPIIVLLGIKRGVLAPRQALRLSIFVPIIAIAALSLSPAAVNAFMERASSGGDFSYTLERILPIAQPLAALTDAPIFGMGIGVTHGSALTIMSAEWPWWLQDLIFEDEMARVIVEVGVIGFLLTYTLRVLIVRFALRCTLSYKDPFYRALGIALMIHLATGLVLPIVNNVTAGAYYWGALGLVFAMRRLEKSLICGDRYSG